jgi:hypothetical protein
MPWIAYRPSNCDGRAFLEGSCNGDQASPSVQTDPALMIVVNTSIVRPVQKPGPPFSPLFSSQLS